MEEYGKICDKDLQVPPGAGGNALCLLSKSLEHTGSA
jgi:hypothetical protein